MRSENLTSTATALWEVHRDQFPVTRNVTYLNHAAVAPLCLAAAEAQKSLSDDALNYGSWHYDRWMACYDGFRNEAARMINAKPQEIAIVKNTSEGVATVQLGIDWRAGDAVVAFREEFPANYYPWQRLAAKGVEVRWLSIYDPLDKIDETARGARLLAISYVNYLSGHRVDIEAIGEICRRHGCFFFLDAIQGLGVYPIDVRKCGIHALSADGHKWLLGPEGCGVLYIQHDLQDSIEPIEFGWTNVAAYNDYASRDMTLRPDAGRYECGTLNTVGCYGLEAAMRYLNSVEASAPGQMARDVTALTDQAAAGAVSKGYRLLGDRNPATSAGIVSFQKEGVESRLIWSRLRENRITTAPRQGWVRVSPHFYNSPADIAKLIDLL